MPPITQRLCGERDEISDLFFVGDGGDAFGHADAEIDDAVGLEFERGAARDDFSRAVFHRRQGPCARADLRGIGGIVLRGEGLPVVLGPGHHDAIDQHARHFHLAWIERAAFGDALDLRDHDAVGIVRGHGDGERFERQRFLLHCQIAVRIAGRSPNDADIDRESLVEEIFLAIDFHQTDDVLLRLLVELAAAVTRIDESAKADARDMAGSVRSNVAEQMRDHALRQIIGLDLVGDGEMLQLRHQAPVATDDSAHEPLVREMVQSALLPVALACRIDQRQIARMARRWGFGVA